MYQYLKLIKTWIGNSVSWTMSWCDTWLICFHWEASNFPSHLFLIACLIRPPPSYKTSKKVRAWNTHWEFKTWNQRVREIHGIDTKSWRSRDRPQLSTQVPPQIDRVTFQWNLSTIKWHYALRKHGKTNLILILIHSVFWLIMLANLLIFILVFLLLCPELFTC